MEPIILSDANFQKEVIESSVPVLVDFWAVWCGPCRIQGPIVEDLAKELDASKVKIGKLDVDQNQQTSMKYNIMSIPTLLIFKQGKVVDQMVGVQQKSTLKEKFNKYF